MYKKEFLRILLQNIFLLIVNIIFCSVTVTFVPKLAVVGLLVIASNIVWFIIDIKRFKKYILPVYFKMSALRQITPIEPAVGYISDLLTLMEKIQVVAERENTYLLLQKNAQLESLQQQINPHFLYNVLDSARGLALAEKALQTADMLEALAVFFRYSITGANDLLELNAELQGIQNYLKIQQYRFGNQFQITYDIHLTESQLSSIRIPKLTLQPIIENAINHGFSVKREGASINIRIIPTQSRLNISIIDNGTGMTDAKLQKLNTEFINNDIDLYSEKGKSGIALQNINSRIKLLFGQEYGLYAYSTLGQGTEIQLTIPLLGNKNERSFALRKN